MNRLQRVIQQRADERGWSLNHVAERSDLNRQTLYKLMRAPEFKRMPNMATLEKLSFGLQLPERLLVEAAAESVGIRVYDEPVEDPDTKVVIASMEKLSPARRRAIRQMAEALLAEYEGRED